MYEFKPVGEIVRSVALAVAVYAATTLSGLAAVDDWRTYGVMVGYGLANVVGTALLAALTRPRGPGAP